MFFCCTCDDKTEHDDIPYQSVVPACPDDPGPQQATVTEMTERKPHDLGKPAEAAALSQSEPERQLSPAEPAVALPQAPVKLAEAKAATFAPCEEREITICVDANQDIGLDIQQTDASELVILKVNKGVIMEWNKQNPDRTAKHGDHIVDVSGGSAPTPLEKLREQKALKLKIRRSVEWTATLSKMNGESKIGIDITNSVNESLVVKSVKEGMVDDWNKANPHLRVEVDDRIIGCCGVFGDSQKILATIKQMDKLDMVFSRNRAETDMS